jgi:hypothetical protein
MLICIFISSQTFAQEKKDTVRVLLVGNSYIYYNNLAQMIGLISDSLDTKIICKKSTIGAATLGQHWNNERGLKTKKIIEDNFKEELEFFNYSFSYPFENK